GGCIRIERLEFAHGLICFSGETGPVLRQHPAALHESDQDCRHGIARLACLNALRSVLRHTRIELGRGLAVTLDDALNLIKIDADLLHAETALRWWSSGTAMSRYTTSKWSCFSSSSSPPTSHTNHGWNGPMPLMSRSMAE